MRPGENGMTQGQLLVPSEPLRHRGRSAAAPKRKSDDVEVHVGEVRQDGQQLEGRERLPDADCLVGRPLAPDVEVVPGVGSESRQAATKLIPALTDNRGILVPNDQDPAPRGSHEPDHCAARLPPTTAVVAEAQAVPLYRPLKGRPPGQVA